MSVMHCPFCGTEVASGLTVCRGCQAEITYHDSALGELLGMLLAFPAGFMGLSLGWHMFDGLDALVFAGLFGIAGLFLGGMAGGLIGSIFQKNGPTFHRRYYQI